MTSDPKDCRVTWRHRIIIIIIVYMFYVFNGLFEFFPCFKCRYFILKAELLFKIRAPVCFQPVGTLIEVCAPVPPGGRTVQLQRCVC